MTQKFLMFAAILALAFTSCKKDEEATTLKAALTAGSWKTTASTYDDDGTGPNAAVSDLDDCDKDDVYTYTSDGKGSVNYGSVKCDPTDPATESVIWALSSDEKTLTITPTSFPLAVSLTVISWSSTEIKVSYNDVIGSGVSYETWTKQ